MIDEMIRRVELTRDVMGRVIKVRSPGEKEDETGSVISMKDIKKITKTEYTFEGEIGDNTLITWEVRAFNAKGIDIAESSRSFIVKYE